MHTNSKLLFGKYARPFFKPGLKVLEIGPNAFPSTYQQIVNEPTSQWDGLDIYESPKLTYSKSDPYSFTIPDNSYDIVLSGQVFEHVPRIWRWMPELARVTKLGGYVITVSPSSWPYHEAPIDCWRTFPEGMKALAEDSGLAVEVCLFESLEFPHLTNCIPGRSREFQPLWTRRVFKILAAFGFPVEKAFDTITIARKIK